MYISTFSTPWKLLCSSPKVIKTWILYFWAKLFANSKDFSLFSSFIFWVNSEIIISASFSLLLKYTLGTAKYIKIFEVKIIKLINPTVNMYVFENNFNFFITAPQTYSQFP